MSSFVGAVADELDGESLDAMGVRLDVGRRDEVAVAAAPCRADVLKMDEAALL